MSHTITITKMPDDVDDDWGWEKRGTCDSNCRLWFPGGPDEEVDINDDQVIDGVRWSWIEGEWMHEDSCCALEWHDDSLWQALENDLGDSAHVGGTYAVETDYQGDGDWTFIIDPNEEAADHGL